MSNKANAKKARKDAVAVLPEEDFFGGACTNTGRSLPLITFDDQRFDVNPEAVTLLHNIQSPMAVVVVAGLYRTGKSFLLNRVILGKQNAFKVGPTTRACTKGIWMWSEPLTSVNEKGQSVSIVVLDTEGIGAPTADATHDTRIFALGLLLATYFIYNSVGSIDEQALSNMALVTNLSAQIRRESSQDENEYPAFLWVVRDFALQMQSGDGKSIGSADYLEESLKDCEASHVNAAAKNKVRSSLRDFFPVRDCYTLVRPCTMEEQLQSLDQLPNKLLRPEFLSQAAQLRQRVFHVAGGRRFTVKGVELNGSMLASLCQKYVDAINQGEVPVIQDAWSYVCDAQRLKCEEACIASCLTACVRHIDEACHVSELRERVTDTCDQLLAEYRESCGKLYARDAVTSYMVALEKRLHDLSQPYITQFDAKFYSMVCDYVYNALAQLESKLMRHEFVDMAHFRTAVHDCRSALCDRFQLGGEQEENVTSLVWWTKVEALLWRAMTEYYGGKDAEVMKLRAELQALTQQHETAVEDVMRQSKEALVAAHEAHRYVVCQLEDQVRDAELRLASATEQVERLSTEVLKATSSAAAQVAVAEQQLDQERLKCASAESEVLALREELEDLTADCRVVHDVARELSESNLERERLRGELSAARRQLAEERESFEAMEQGLLQESQAMQAKALESLAVVKEGKRVEVAALRQAKEQAVQKVTCLELKLSELEAEVSANAKVQDDLCKVRQQVDDLEHRLASAQRELSTKQTEWERHGKSVERDKDQALSKAREERMRSEQEFLHQLHQLETRAVRAEAAEAEKRRQLELAEERYKRKRPRVDEDGDGRSLELAKKEAEVVWLRTQKMEVDTQLAQLRKENDKLQVQQKALERSLNSEKTRLTLEYEAKMSALQQKLHV